ncbi:hypothetical protein CBM2586_A10532 [Cupriavidus phytorum]|uniref:Uncharacterized protein n=1 Tax=Cupriavidus taiwanensis TaxID=164546 RepID=A0A975ZVV2_9BURK|nr:hypothetical protein CBM2586_A10532 [Cupriavidus taiwanensis]
MRRKGHRHGGLLFVRSPRTPTLIRTPAPCRPGSAPLIYVNVNVIQSIRPNPGAQPARFQPSRHRTAPADAAVAANTPTRWRQ